MVMLRKLVSTTATIMIILLALSGCAGKPMTNVEIHPPSKGLIHYLQQDQMANVSDHGYRAPVDTTSARKLQSEEEASIELQVLDPSGQPVQHFKEDMTKLMHLIVVSSDLSTFQHIHPDYVGNGWFHAKVNFPHGGQFLLISEFMPDSAGLTVYKQWVTVDGEKADSKKLEPDKQLTQTVDGLQITLSAMPDAAEVRAGDMAMLNFTLKDAATGKFIQLEPYLGTAGHCVILDEKAKQYLHVHATTDMSSASNVMFHTQFPKAGIYKLWGQFQYKGKVIVAPFVIEVK
ncbi:hypothetical protein [Paenibacillus sp. OV219]|uniref:hypothetical protein n=1 Tax=Paenibacillus sp. OV219 TaxID=1884377 RepID=UPI0008AACC0D|nr:hypothetical protein [Paenibacillus sp. OV219]SEN83941.1 hypothetical protein SAMN05518847_104267 [Paenibacillus sp. OV219]